MERRGGWGTHAGREKGKGGAREQEGVEKRGERVRRRGGVRVGERGRRRGNNIKDACLGIPGNAGNKPNCMHYGMHYGY